MQHDLSPAQTGPPAPAQGPVTNHEQLINQFNDMGGSCPGYTVNNLQVFTVAGQGVYMARSWPMAV